MDGSELRERLANPRYPRSATYDPVWVVENRMGPNVLWLTEWLSEAVSLVPDMSVLDLGCGTALSSIFLSKEFGVRVWAADLWVDPSDNRDRVRASGLEDSVVPVRVEAHELPFADACFDAVVSVDAYHYFGTDDDYLGYISKFIRPGGTLGLVVPSVRHELEGVAPPGLEKFWQDDMFTFHTPPWWRHNLGREMTVTTCDWLDGGGDEWQLWCEVCGDHLRPKGQAQGDDECADMLRADVERVLGLARVVANKSGSPAL